MERPHSQNRMLVVGLGNPLNGDDGFGHLVLERLKLRERHLRSGVDLAGGHTDLLDQMDRFPAYDQVVMVDAVLDPEGCVGNAGQIVVLEEETLLEWPADSSSIHQISPLLALKLFRRLYPHARTRIRLVALCTDRIALGSRTDKPPGYLSDDVVDGGVLEVRRLMMQSC